MNGKRVDAAFELLGQGCIDESMAFKPGFAAKDLRDDGNDEVCLSSRASPGMADMPGGIVNHVESLGRESPC